MSSLNNIKDEAQDFATRRQKFDESVDALNTVEAAINDFKALCEGDLTEMEVTLAIAENHLALALCPSKAIEQLLRAAAELDKLVEAVEEFSGKTNAAV